MNAAKNTLRFVTGVTLTAAVIGISSYTPTLALSPTKVSQLVTLDANSESIGCAGVTEAIFFDVRMRKNGLPQGGFSIPAGKVLVVTSAEVEVRGPADSGAEVRLFVGNRSQGGEVSRQSVAVDANGFGTANFQLSNGIAIASGRSLCVLVHNGTATFFGGSAHGYLAPDN